jgi:hypothetical protein
MTKNMGTVDRSIRILAAIAIGILYFMNVISGTVAIILGVFAVIFVVTSFIGWCPAYLPIGLSSCSKTDG